MSGARASAAEEWNVAGVVNSMIAAEYAAGASISELAERWGIDPRQVVERISAAAQS
jgi:uncharacterized protein (DUF433 family)